MYTSFFRLKENPFNLTPDPRYLFLSEHHKEALDHLLYGINERKGFILITGGIGTGKTTLCRVLLDHLERGTKSALIFNSLISELELLKTINQEFGISTSSRAETKKEYIDNLNQFLLKTFGEGGNAILLIDEAQNLSHGVLEQIRMLSNLETTREKLIQIILVGQPELAEILATPSMRQLNERVMVRYDLRSLAFKDILGYVEHRLVVAGGRGNLHFTRGALKLIYGYSKGNPRRINTLCDRALLIAYARGKYTISRAIVKKALLEIRGDLTAIPKTGGWSWKRYASYAFLLLLLTLIAGLGGWSYNEDILQISLGKKRPFITKRKVPESKLPKPVKKNASLVLDEKASLSFLFSLYNEMHNLDNQGPEDYNLSLVRFNLDPEYYVMLKKPFRGSLSGPSGTTGYLLIRETKEDGAIVIDANGKKRTVTRDFILNNLGRQLSWVYPAETREPTLFRGMKTPEVLELQGILKNIGYIVEPTGIYNQQTFQVTMKFQKDFGLKPDGIAGPRTRALLYQMVKEDESYQ